MTHSGYNQEDSILFNKGSIDRGLFHATIYHTEKDDDKKTNGEEEIRIKPNRMTTKNMKFGNYDKINKNGVMDVKMKNGYYLVETQNGGRKRTRKHKTRKHKTRRHKSRRHRR
jgi:DNA-directed RNA polymerase beta subunit